LWTNGKHRDHDIHVMAGLFHIDDTVIWKADVACLMPPTPA
jgi:hypothetical protein